MPSSRAQGGWLLQVVGNVSGTYSVTITATFTMVETVGNSTVTLSSSLSTSESVETRAFELTFRTQLSNVTNSLRQVLRNSDGSFYHGDEFRRTWRSEFVTLLISVWKVNSNARVSTDSLVEREEERVTVELPTVSTMVKVAVIVTEYVPETFPTTWSSQPPLVRGGRHRRTTTSTR